MTQRIFVVAQGRNDFLDWCEDNGIDHRSIHIRSVLPANSGRELRGTFKPLYVAVGVDWQQQRNLAIVQGVEITTADAVARINEYDRPPTVGERIAGLKAAIASQQAGIDMMEATAERLEQTRI